jgi:hypothetical protein
LIAARKEISNYPIINVAVSNVGGGIANECLDNAQTAKEENGWTLISGWIVGEYNKEDDSTEIIQHWWNQNGDVHIDTTPLVHNNFEYVWDFEVAITALQSQKAGGNNILRSLLLKGGKWYAAHKENSVVVKLVELPQLDLSVLTKAIDE